MIYLVAMEAVERAVSCRRSSFLNVTVSPEQCGPGSHFGIDGSVYRQVKPVAIAVIIRDNAITSDPNGLSRKDAFERLNMGAKPGFRTGFITIGEFRQCGVVTLRCSAHLQVFTILSRLAGTTVFEMVDRLRPLPVVVLRFLTPLRVGG